MIESVRWQPNKTNSLIPGKLRIIDQTKLPERLEFIETDNAQEIYDAIKRLVVRGAPAIGCAAALGLGAVCQHSMANNRLEFLEELDRVAKYFAGSRPTAVNLFWALNRCLTRLKKIESNDVVVLKEVLVQEGINILEEDIQMRPTKSEHTQSQF